ncbi:MAG TPA: hypothetical protein V6D10_07230 [Trichocoleus sp.]
MEIQSWLKELLRWLKQMLGIDLALPSHLEILQEYHSDSVSVFRLQDTSIPGCIDLWKIERHHERLSFWICAINLSQLRVDLSERRIVDPLVYVQARHSALAQTLATQIQTQTQYLASHYWISGFVSEYSGTDAKGRHFKSRRIHGVHLLAGDFQGIAGVYAGDKYIRRYNRQIIDQLANDRFRELKYHMTWRAAVSSIDWAPWLEGLCQSYDGGIDPTHRLQVLKAKTLRRGKGNA